MASVAHLTAAISVGTALIPAGLAELRYTVAPSVPAKPGASFQHLAVLPEAAGSLTYVGGGNGHAVAVVQPEYFRSSTDPEASSLVEIAPGKTPRTIASFDGGAAMPSVGTDAAGRVVVVVRPCATYTEDDAPRHCDLAVFDLERGTRRDLPGTSSAIVGDMDHGQLVTVGPRTSVTVGGPASTPKSTPRPMPLGSLISDETHGEAGYGGNVDAIDLERGRIALTTVAGTEAGSDSLLLTAPVGGSWTTLAVNDTGGAAQGSRNFNGPQITSTGVRAYLDGAGDFGSFAQRWSLNGTLVSKVRASAFGGASWVTSAAFDGTTLITAPTPECDGHCQVEASSPVPD